MAGFQPLWQVADAGFEALELTSAEGFEPLARWVEVARPEEAAPTAAHPPRPQPAPSSEPGQPVPQEPQAEPVDAEDTEPSDVALLRLREEAFEAGRRDGLEAGQAELADRIARVDDLARQLGGLRDELFSRSIEDLSSAVMHIARRIVGRELAVSSEGVEALVREILSGVKADDEVIVRLAEPDAAMMREAWPALMELVGRDGELHLEIDGRLQPGGAIVETRHGTIDASVEARFTAYEQTIGAWARHELEAIDD